MLAGRARVACITVAELPERMHEKEGGRGFVQGLFALVATHRQRAHQPARHWAGEPILLYFCSQRYHATHEQGRPRNTRTRTVPPPTLLICSLTTYKLQRASMQHLCHRVIVHKQRLENLSGSPCDERDDATRGAGVQAGDHCLIGSF